MEKLSRPRGLCLYYCFELYLHLFRKSKSGGGPPGKRKKVFKHEKVKSKKMKTKSKVCFSIVYSSIYYISAKIHQTTSITALILLFCCYVPPFVDLFVICYEINLF